VSAVETSPVARPRPRAGADAVPPLPTWIALTCCGAVLAFLGAIVVAHEVLDKPLLVFIVEPASIGTNIWYAGVLSTTGGLLWWTAASVSYVTAWISRVTGAGAAGFWLGLAVLTTVLALDDLFQGHEIFYRVYLHLPEEVSGAIYAVVAAALAIVYRSYLRTLPWRIALVALALFSFSEALDFLYPQGDTEYELLLEDGSKFAGIAAWALFVVWGSQAVLLHGVRRRDGESLETA
jgi:hypothetical protein